MKRAFLGVVAAGLMVAGVGTSVADSWHKVGSMSTTGADFLEGRYRFNSSERNHGSFEWEGKLRDTKVADGHNVYVMVRVESHAWSRYKGKQGKPSPCTTRIGMELSSTPMMRR